MAPKRKAASSAAATSKKKKAPAPDWRVPLFYWKGDFDAGFKQWSGTWVAAEEVPSDKEFADSATSFLLELAATDVTAPADGSVCMEMSLPSFIESEFTTKVEYDRWCKERQEGSGDGETIKALAGSFSGTYKLDNGGGLADYSDLTHDFKSLQTTGGCVVCVAKGTTEFGAFVSMGTLVGTTLTLARRYIGDKDPRKKQSLADALDSLQGSTDTAEQLLSKLQQEALPWRVDL